MPKPELIGIAGIILLLLITTPFYFQSPGTGTGGSSSDGNISFIDLNDTPNSYSGQGLKVVQVNPTETGLQFTTISGIDTNCDNNPNCTITGTINTTFDGNYNDMNVNGDINLTEGMAIRFGQPQDWNIYNNGANLRIDQVGGGSGIIDMNRQDVRLDFLGICNNAISNTNVIEGVCSSTVARSLINMVFMNLGSTVANAILGQVQWQTTTAMNGSGITAVGLLDINATNTGTMAGINVTSGIMGARSVNSGTQTFNGMMIRNQPGWTGIVTGSGSVINRGILISALTDYNNNSALVWSLIANDDIQLNGDTLFFEGTDTAKGDTFLDYTPLTNNFNLTVDANSVANFDNNGVSWQVKNHFQHDVNMYKNLTVDQNIYGQTMSLFSVVGTTCNTLCSSIVTAGPWVCVEAITTAGAASTCGQNSVAVNCICQN